MMRICFGMLLIGLTFGCEDRPSGQDRPNILFVISDDQSFAHTSFAGSNFVNTPGFDKIAHEGVYFANCYAGSPGCAPSRSAIVTGRHHWQNEQSGQHASVWLKKYVSFIDQLENNGYRTGRTGKGVGPFRYDAEGEDPLIRKTDAAGLTRSNIRYSPDNDQRHSTGISKINYFENFKYFLENSRKDTPFFFWFGAYEPHRVYEKGSWKRLGKKLEDAEVPGFLPDSEVTRGDILDYAVEIEWFDQHLQKMLEYLEATGELENTIVIVTADNGMPFPRAKSNAYEYGVHVPMAIRYPKNFPGGRVVDDPIGFIDLAPTMLEVTNTGKEGMPAMSGRSFLDILKSKEEGIVDSTRKYALSGRERHSSSRYLNLGYPQRAIKNKDFIFIWNMKPERWPAGAPQKFDSNDTTRLLPIHGLDQNGQYIPDAAYTDIDDSPTKTYIIENLKQDDTKRYFTLAHGKRPEYELYNVTRDPFCLENLSGVLAFRAVENELKEALLKELKRSNDPRITGPDTEIFDRYKRYSRMRKFPKPEQVE